MAELADAADLKSAARKGVRVQISAPAPNPGGRPRIAAAGSGKDDWCSALFGLLQAIELPSRPGIIGVWERLTEGPLLEIKPPEPPREWAVPPAPETPREQCQTVVRVGNEAVRCGLTFGHRGGHAAPVPA